MQRFLFLIKPLVFLACLIPLTRLGWGFWQDALGANPIEALTRGLGTWALNFLLITLAITPARKLLGLPWLGRLRRLLGLYAFFYGLLHLLSYLWLDQFFVLQDIARDILKRPFITAGMAAFVLLVPLAVTSNNYAIRRLGGKRWNELHRTVYAIGLLALLHYAWLVKLDITKPVIYGLILAALLGIRVFWRYRESVRQRAGAYPKKNGRRIIPIVVKR